MEALNLMQQILLFEMDLGLDGRLKQKFEKCVNFIAGDQISSLPFVCLSLSKFFLFKDLNSVILNLTN